MKLRYILLTAFVAFSCQKPPSKAAAFEPEIKPQVAMPKPGEVPEQVQAVEEGRDSGAATVCAPVLDSAGPQAGFAAEVVEEPAPSQPAEPQARPLRISVMGYNVENLFDHVKDGDEQTVIKCDVLQKKLAQIAKGILQVNNGHGPDILMVEEVENLNVLRMLNEHLQAAGYQTIELIESNDERGIDVGIFSRFPTAGESQLHQMPFGDVNPTRGIMEVPLALPNGRTVHAFAYHFPSQANPTAQRREASEYLKDLMLRVPQGDLALAAGDSNITTKEERENNLFGGVFKDLQVSHLIGCEGCQGTYNYRGTWDFLDAVITREPTLQAASVRIPQDAPTQKQSNGYPRRFDANANAGISDHFPIYAELLIPN